MLPSSNCPLENIFFWKHMFIQDLAFNNLCCFCFFLDFVRKCGLDVVVSMTQIKCGFTLMLMKSSPVRQLCFWVPAVPETKVCGNVFLIEILSGKALSLNGSAMQNTFLGMFVFGNGKLLQNFAHVLSPALFPIPLDSLSLFLCLCTSDHSIPVVLLCYQCRGRNRLSPCTRNQFVSAHQVSRWKCQCWVHTWYSRNEIMGHHKFCRELLSVSLMFRVISTR